MIWKRFGRHQHIAFDGDGKRLAEVRPFAFGGWVAQFSVPPFGTSGGFKSSVAAKRHAEEVLESKGDTA